MGYKHNIEDVLDKGMNLFRTQGYHNVGINQILKECAIPKGSFYNFFKTKEDFAEQIVNRYGESSRNLIRSFLEEKNLTPIERLRSFYAMIVNSNANENFAGGCLINTLSNEVGRNIDRIGKVADENFMTWVDIIADCIAEGQELGEIRDDFTAVDLAEHLHAGTYGAMARSKVTRNREYFDKWFAMSFAFIRK